MKLFFTLFVTLFLWNNGYTAEDFYKTNYTIKKGDTFANILRKYVKENSIINAKSPMIHMTRAKNPHIKSWAKLEEGQKIELYISKKFLNLPKVISQKKKEKLIKGRPSGYHSSVFYMASAGNFTQTSSSSGVDIKFTQNSLLSLGYTAIYFPKEKPYSFSGSVYFSTLNASESNLNQEVSVDPEIGFNGYMEYSWSKFSLYGGFDFEKFLPLIQRHWLIILF